MTSALPSLGPSLQLLEPLGQGGTGIVYRARQHPLGREVAVKVLRPHLFANPEARARFEREARVAGTLRHRGAVPVYDFGEHEGQAYLVMELAKGPTLRSDIGQLSVAEALRVARELADVLAHAHRQGLVHRDLKPDNVVMEQGQPRVLDFGLAFVTGESPTGRMTAQGIVAGTPAYLSPEQARGEEDVGPATDVYALGAMLYEMLAGSPPFADDSELDVLTRQLFSPPPPLRTRLSDRVVPTAAETLVMAMLAKRPAERPSAEGVRDELDHLGPERLGAHSVGRQARMLPAPAQPRREDGELEVALLSPISAASLLALSANGLRAFVTDSPPPDADAIYAPGASADEIEALTQLGPPVVTDAQDIERIAALLRAGASEVLTPPVESAELARRIRRAVRRHAR